MHRFAVCVLALALVSVAAGPAAGQVIPLTGNSSSTDFTDGAALEELDGGATMTFTRQGVTLTVRAVGGVVDCSSNGVGVSATDTLTGANIDGEEAIFISFAQLTRWIYVSVSPPATSSPSDEVPQLCARLIYSGVGGYTEDTVCRGLSGGRIDPPESAQPMAIDMSDAQFVRIARGEGRPFVVDSIYVSAGDNDDAERGVANLAFALFGSAVRFGGGEPPGTFDILLNNSGPDAASGLTLLITREGLDVPEGVVASDESTFDPATGVWTIGAVPADGSRTLHFTARPLAGSGETATLRAAVTSLDQVNNGDSEQEIGVQIVRPGDLPPPTNPLEAIFAVILAACGNGSLMSLVGTTLGIGVMRLRGGRRVGGRRTAPHR